MLIDFPPLVPIGVGVAAIVIVLAVLLIFWKRIWVIAEPNEALIISGTRNTKNEAGFHIVIGRGKMINPLMQRVRFLSLKLRETELKVNCVTSQGIETGVEGVCVYKVGGNEPDIANAAQRFLGQDDEAMDRNIQHLFEGHTRSIIGSLTFEELIGDGEKLAASVRGSIAAEVSKLGLVIDSLQIKKINDPTKYIEKMSIPHVAQVDQLARVARANQNQTATLAEQLASAAMEQSKRDAAVKIAGLKAEVDSEQAKAAQAGPLAAAQAQQEVLRQQTEIQKLEGIKMEQELTVKVRKPAEAEAYAVSTKATGAKNAAIAEAEAAAKTVELSASAKATATKVTGEANASAALSVGTADASVAKIKLLAGADGNKATLFAEAEGNKAKLLAQAEGTRANLLAEAEGNKAKFLAEAAGIAARGTALAENKEAIISQSIAQSLPEIMKQIAAPFGNISELTVLNGGEGLVQNMAAIAAGAMKILPIITKGLNLGGTQLAK